MLAPTLQKPADANAYVTVIGQLIKFDSAEVEKNLKGDKTKAGFYRKGKGDVETLDGVVASWQFGNPHTWLALRVDDVTWEIEGAPPRWMHSHSTPVILPSFFRPILSRMSVCGR